MGGSLSVCPNRKQVPSAPEAVPNRKQAPPAPVAVPKSTMPKPTPPKDTIKQGATTAAERQPEAAAPPLPTQSWHELLQEASLNPDAKPFVPSKTPTHGRPVADTRQGIPAPPGLSKPLFPVEGKGNDPAWIQYLANKFSESTSTAKAASAAPKLGPLSRSGRLQMAEAGRSNPNGSGGGGVAIQTETYLKLLKEGTPAKKKSSNVPRLPNRGPNVPGRKIAEPGEAGIAMPMTLSSLGKTWSTAMSGETPTAEEVPQVKTTQDDISAEKVLKDQDRSEPAYWSDTESLDLQCASAHWLGRRPKLATAMVRSYVMQDLSYALDQAVGMMIRRLQRYMDHHRAFASKPCQEVGAQTPGRRFVIGLKEVSRRTKQSRVACLIVAPDIEEDANSGGLDDRMRELLAAAYENGTPVIFALTRERLGKALGKSLHISVLGVVDATGARDLLQESLHLADKCRKAWLARLGK